MEAEKGAAGSRLGMFEAENLVGVLARTFGYAIEIEVGFKHRP
jgi:hypothetical protein